MVVLKGARADLAKPSARNDTAMNLFPARPAGQMPSFLYPSVGEKRPLQKKESLGVRRGKTLLRGAICAILRRS